jgi:hypothetical protein
MMTALRITLLLGLLTASHGYAQQTVQPCSYDECALRVKAATLTAPEILVRGAQDAEVIRLGLFKPAVSSFMVRSDSAIVYAGVYDRLYDTGGVLNIIGTALTIAAPVLLDGFLRKALWTGAGIGLSVYGGVLTNRANDALARAIWFHNRELVGAPREPDAP